MSSSVTLSCPPPAPATFDTQTETKEPASVMSSVVSHLSAVNSSTDLCTADVLCDEQLTAETIASPKEVSLASQLTVLQHRLLCENILLHEQLKQFYTLMLTQSICAASLVNPFMVPELNPPVVYIPTPGSE